MKRFFASVLLLLPLCVAAQLVRSPLLSTSWSQTSPFNDDCPRVGGSASAAGCGAIAVGQILNYHRLLPHGFGQVEYVSKGDTVRVDLEANVFDFDNILNKYSSSSKPEAKRAVASFVFQVGAAMKMQYGTSSTPSNFGSMMWGLQHYLHFSPQSRYRHRRYYSTAEWTEMLNNELENNRPVFYRGDHTTPGSVGGHIFVIDGINKNGNYHFNFGHASSTQDKFTDLSVINQGAGTWPGTFSVCYHHQQAMITDFYPVADLTDKDYDEMALMLTSAMVLGGDDHAKEVRAKGTVQAKFKVNSVSFVKHSIQMTLGFYQGDKLCATSSTVRNLSLNAGYSLSFDRSFNLPGNLPAGEYVMSVVSRADANSPWVRCWDDAPNSVPVTVQSNKTFVFTMPDYHNLECNLVLERDIVEKNVKTGGKTFEFTVCNPSNNNFEDSIRLVVTTPDATKQYDQLTSVYDGQRVTYRFFVANSDVRFSRGYEVKAYYKETAAAEWMPMTYEKEGIRAAKVESSNQVSVYTVAGIRIKHFNMVEGDSRYASFLSSLPKGVYLVCDRNGTRKFVKRT